MDEPHLTTGIDLMSSAEQTFPADRAEPGTFAAPRLRLLRLPLLVALAGWTAYWTWSAVGMVRTFTRIGTGSAGSSIDGHEIFELVFTASHCLVRWAPLAVLLFGAWFWIGRKQTRAG